MFTLFGLFTHSDVETNVSPASSPLLSVFYNTPITSRNKFKNQEISRAIQNNIKAPQTLWLWFKYVAVCNFSLKVAALFQQSCWEDGCAQVSFSNPIGLSFSGNLRFRSSHRQVYM